MEAWTEHPSTGMGMGVGVGAGGQAKVGCARQLAVARDGTTVPSEAGGEALKPGLVWDGDGTEENNMSTLR